MNPFENETDEEEQRQINRGPRFSSCCSSCPASVLSIFCIGMMSGAAGGLLLGGTAVVVFQSLEILADNTLLMEHLENNTFNFLGSVQNYTLTRPFNNHMLNFLISIWVEMFYVLSSPFSSVVGIGIGSFTYVFVINKDSEAAKGKALALAGSVCLMVVTAMGYMLGLGFEDFQFIKNRVLFYMFFNFVPIVAKGFIFFTVCEIWDRSLFIALFLYFLVYILVYILPGIFLFVLIDSLLIKTKLVLMFFLLPFILLLELLKNPLRFQLTITPVPLMLLLTDVFNIARHPIVTLQSATNTSSIVVEGIFVGVLTSQLLMVAIGMSLFLSWQQGGAAKICASATACGTAVLAVIEMVLWVLGPGPTLGAVMGVSGAVGVSLSAAVAATDRYGETVDQYGVAGRLGVTVGAGVGAFLSSCAHSGLSHMFMGLCGAVIPAGLYLQLLFMFIHRHRTWWGLVCSVIVITIFVILWLVFFSKAAGFVTLKYEISKESSPHIPAIG